MSGLVDSGLLNVDKLGAVQLVAKISNVIKLKLLNHLRTNTSPRKAYLSLHRITPATPAGCTILHTTYQALSDLLRLLITRGFKLFKEFI